LVVAVDWPDVVVEGIGGVDVVMAVVVAAA
jgi:hypothetical protein